MNFPSKNLNVLKPVPLAIAFVVLAIASALGWLWLNSTMFVLGDLRFTPISIAAFVVAVAVLWDAHK